MQVTTIPSAIDDPVNQRILAVSEDRIQGFHPRPFDEIAHLSSIEPALVLERIRAMLQAGTIRRVRQTLLATNLASGALVAWQVPPQKLNAAFDWFFQQDPFTGHVVIRTTDAAIAGAAYRLWTTVKVPQGFSLARHCHVLAQQVGATDCITMPARKLFALGVGHMRRRALHPGDMSPAPAQPIEIREIQLSDEEWAVLLALKREFTTDEIVADPWTLRARQAGVTPQEFLAVAARLNQRGIIGRFSTFLEHVKPLADGQSVTRFNALFHWAVPQGCQEQAGCEVGRFHILTHAYWREGGAAFNHVNIMAVAHGTDRDLLLAHKKAMDAHLAQMGIPVTYTNVFWGGRSEIKPSEIAPQEYIAWCRRMNLDPQAMRA